nr:MAG TPA: hypothetical protein [Caudoviricetes sp.]
MRSLCCRTPILYYRLTYYTLRHSRYILKTSFTSYYFITSTSFW